MLAIKRCSAVNIHIPAKMAASVPCLAANNTAQKCTENQVPAAHMVCFFHCPYTRISVNESANQTILRSKDNQKIPYATLTLSKATLSIY